MVSNYFQTDSILLLFQIQSNVTLWYAYSLKLNVLFQDKGSFGFEFLKHTHACAHTHTKNKKGYNIGDWNIAIT